MNNQEKNYWENYYKNNLLETPSNFSLFIMEYFKSYNNLKILDCGCGTGRDTYFFSKKHNIIGIDQSYKPIDKANCKFFINDFCHYDKSLFDLIYSRFSFHSITNEQQDIFLKSINKKDTFLCIETRSIKGKTDYRYTGDNHYRNLTDIDYLKNRLKDNNFEILFIEENKNFAIYKNENPICIRIICKKL
tara:strand:- start:9564 stop:10133 length:570 start_codon:yes stop_codon:yes gene_type:complete